MKYYITTNCKECNKPFKKFISKRSSRRASFVRRSNTVCCSKLCSRRYNLKLNKWNSYKYHRIKRINLLYYNLKNCVVCDRVFIIPNNPYKQRERNGIVRPFNALTCSQECSIDYSRKTNTEYHLNLKYQNLKYKLKQEEE